MRYLPKVLVLAALVSVQVAVGIAFSAGCVTSLYSGEIPPGVYVGGVSVTGLGPSSLSQAIEKLFPANSAELNLVFTDGDRRWTIPYRNLEVSSNLVLLVERAATHLDNGSAGTAAAVLRLFARPLDLRPGFYYRRNLLARRLAAISRETDRSAENAALTWAGDKVILVPGKLGRQLDVRATLGKVGPLLALDGESVPLVFSPVAPAIGASRLAPLDRCLAAFSTRLGPGQDDRNHNVALAARLVNGTLLLPGRVFSLNARLGPRTKKRGFWPAPAIVGDTLVNESGGGVCQVATTLYNAALLAGLAITERYPHLLPVPYVPLGRDATINWDDLDLKLANDTGQPVYIAAQVRNLTLTVRIFGEGRAGKRFSVYTRVTTPAGFPLPPPDQLALGSDGADTIAVAVYRQTTGPDGRITTQLVSLDYYHRLAGRPRRRK